MFCALRELFCALFAFLLAFSPLKQGSLQIGFMAKAYRGLGCLHFFLLSEWWWLSALEGSQLGLYSYSIWGLRHLMVLHIKNSENHIHTYFQPLTLLHAMWDLRYMTMEYQKICKSFLFASDGSVLCLIYMLKVHVLSGQVMLHLNQRPSFPMTFEV